MAFVCLSFSSHKKTQLILHSTGKSDGPEAITTQQKQFLDYEDS